METLQVFINTLRENLDKELTNISNEESEFIPKAKRSIASLKKHINELKSFICNYKFASVQEEVIFFKGTKPELASQLLFFNKLLELSINEPFGSRDMINSYYQQEMCKLGEVRNTNPDFYRYYVAGETYLDQEYFTRYNQSSGDGFDKDQRFTTRYDSMLSQIIANMKIKEYIQSMTDLVDSPKEDNPSPLLWTRSKADLVELIYALHASAPFNDGVADIKVIATMLEKTFNIRINNIYRLYQDIRLRKINPTNFLDLMKQKLQHRLEED